jgi:hypothetical protein
MLTYTCYLGETLNYKLFTLNENCRPTINIFTFNSRRIIYLYIVMIVKCLSFLFNTIDKVYISI